ncbi:MAG: hypothetical protein DMF89_09915 [Acidobacteria bacterium]|nr:MAG: hypothetical protein DMF89_09915 [Acidobacteriota bacterium]
MDSSERYEQLIAFLSTHLPAPVEQEEDANGVIVFTGGSPGEVIARLTATSVIVEEFAIRWETLYSPVIQPRRVGAVNWRRLPETAVMNVVGQLIKGAREIRRARYRTCGLCGVTNPPEWLHSDDICQTCAESRLGLVH